jgi:translation initiation factor IF-3|tara:strand:- start:550 stop:1200 length:651 start_codon:yes stop_codon:yes gene_type:complete
MKFNGVLYSDWPSVVTGLFIFTSKWRNNIAKNYRVNDRIRVPSVLLVDDKGNQLGEMSTPDAIALASERGLDLVEVAPAAEPPVCRILNYGKFRYEATRKEREARKANKAKSKNQLREVRMKTRIGEHDRLSKTRLVKRLLSQGSKVKVSIIFRGREMQHPQIGMDLLKIVAEDLGEDALLDKAPSFEGRFLAMVLAPSASLKKSIQNKELESAKA